MKMAKATQKDIDAAGEAMALLNDISSGHYPARQGDECIDTFFDPDEFDHLRKFYELMNATLDKSAGWPGRVIGGMCYVVMYDKNEIVDPASDTLEIHPRFAKVAQQRDELMKALETLQSAVLSLGIDATAKALAKAQAALSNMEDPTP